MWFTNSCNLKKLDEVIVRKNFFSPTIFSKKTKSLINSGVFYIFGEPLTLVAMKVEDVVYPGSMEETQGKYFGKY